MEFNESGGDCCEVPCELCSASVLDLAFPVFGPSCRSVSLFVVVFESVFDCFNLSLA